MGSFNRFILRVGRAETPFFRFLKKCIKLLYYPTLPVLPRWVLKPARFFYELHFLIISVFRSIAILLYYNPLFQARCASFGKKVSLDGMVFVNGPVEIHVGDQVKFGGKVSILSGKILDQPRLIMKDRSGVGWGTTIAVNQEVILEEDVIVSYNCNISDTDGHCKEADLRAAGVPPKPQDIRPVRICKHAWIGNGSYIMKGVTIGEGAIVGANSVVITNIPPYSLAMGNPAEVILRNVGLPSTAQRKKQPAAPPDATT